MLLNPDPTPYTLNPCAAGEETKSDQIGTVRYYNEDEEDLPESKDETLTEGFTLSFAKVGSLEPWTCTLRAETLRRLLKRFGCVLRQEVLLTPDAGRSSYSLYRAEPKTIRDMLRFNTTGY